MCFSEVGKVKLLQKRRKMKSSWERCLIQLERCTVGIPFGYFWALASAFQDSSEADAVFLLLPRLLREGKRF